MRKRIGIDARLLQKTGVGVYLRNLLLEYRNLFPTEWELVLFILPEDRFVAAEVSPEAQLVEVTTRWHSVDEQIRFLRILLAQKIDLMHFPYFSYPVLYNRPYVATVHDLTLIHQKTGQASTRHPVLYSIKHMVFRQIIQRQIQNARHIMVPTMAVENDILTMYRIPHEKITVTYEGVDKILMSCKPRPPQQGTVPKDFLLYVGNFYPHKNMNRLLEAYAQTPMLPALVLCGPEDFFSGRVRHEIQKLGIESRVVMFTDVPVETVSYLYRQARAFIHPSLAEGFGLPIVEAMHFGLPIIASDIPVFQEILGTSGRYFDPYAVDSIGGTIRSFIKNGFHQKPISYSTLSRFSFSTMAEKTRECYRLAFQE